MLENSSRPVESRTIMMSSTNGPASKHQIGFNNKNQIGDRNQGFRAGGPIKATGAVFEGMNNQI